jgi:hypothetical protein
MNKLDALHKINELLFTELLEVRSRVKKKLMKDFEKDIPTGDIIDQVDLFMTLTDKLNVEVGNKIRGINQNNLFEKGNYDREKKTIGN